MSDPSAGSGRGPSTSSGRGALERALAWLRRQRTEETDGSAPLERLTASAFRAVVDERLRNLEHQLDEVKGRVNGLIFLLAGAVASQLILRLLG